MLNKFKPTGDHQHRKNQLVKYRIEQEVLCRQLDGNKCMNPNCQKKAVFSWQIDVHHGLGRSPEFLAVKYLICLCSVCHALVESDNEIMIEILESHLGEPHYRWQELLSRLKNKRRPDYDPAGTKST